MPEAQTNMTAVCDLGSWIVGALRANAIVVKANNPSYISLVNKEFTYTRDDLRFDTELILESSCNIIESSSTIWLCVRGMSNAIEHMTGCEHQDCHLESEQNTIVLPSW